MYVILDNKNRLMVLGKQQIFPTYSDAIRAANQLLTILNDKYLTLSIAVIQEISQ